MKAVNVGKKSKKSAPAKSKGEEQNGNILKEIEVGPYTVRWELYRGKPSCGIHLTSRIDAGEEYTLVIGFMLNKARALTTCMDEIEKFVAKYGDDSE